MVNYINTRLLQGSALVAVAAAAALAVGSFFVALLEWLWSNSCVCCGAVLIVVVVAHPIYPSFTGVIGDTNDDGETSLMARLCAVLECDSIVAHIFYPVRTFVTFAALFSNASFFLSISAWVSGDPICLGNLKTQAEKRLQGTLFRLFFSLLGYQSGNAVQLSFLAAAQTRMKQAICPLLPAYSIYRTNQPCVLNG